MVTCYPRDVPHPGRRMARARCSRIGPVNPHETGVARFPGNPTACQMLDRKPLPVNGRRRGANEMPHGLPATGKRQKAAGLG